MELPKPVLALAGMMLVMLAANGIMVWYSTGQHDLVRTDYYDAGLEQDKVIARTDLSQAEGMSITFGRDSSGWRAEAGSAELVHTICSIHFYRPDDGREDALVDLGRAEPSAVASGRLVWKGPGPLLRQGYWVARLVWEENGKAVMEKSYPVHIPG